MRRSTSLCLTMMMPIAGCAAASPRARPAAPAAAAAAAAPRDAITAAASSGPAVLIDDGASPLAVTTPESAGLRRDALERLVREAERTGTDALVVVKGETVVVARRWSPPSRLELMSVTKGFAGLAIGFLLDEGKIASVDAPLSTWFPEWSRGDKGKVTLRHVLTHTSGLAHEPAARELTMQKDRLAWVRALPIESEPGKTFSYNNEATQLLSGVVAAAAHEPIDAYLKRKLFDPLDIHDVAWTRDAAGNVATFYGLELGAFDLARVGACLRDGGVFHGTQVVPRAWIERMIEPADEAPWHGMLTWLLYDGPFQVQTPARRAALAKAGFRAADALAPLDGRRFPSRAAYWMEAGARLDAGARDALAEKILEDLLPIENVDGKLVGWNFNGWLGQYLVVYPSAGVVAVRQRREPPNVTDEDNDRIGMKAFPRLVRAAF